jgi:hypothetical protein
MTTAISEFYTNKSIFKDRSSLIEAFGDLGSNASDIIKAIRDRTPMTTARGMSKEDWIKYVEPKQNLCLKSAIAERCTSIGLPTIPTIVPDTLDEVKEFCKENGTVIFKPVKGHDCLGNKEYHYRPMEEAEVLEEIALDLAFFKNQADKINQAVVMQKFYALDGKDSYHYSFKGWVDNGGNFFLSHSYTEEWGVDPNYDSTRYRKLTNQAMSNALNVSTTTYETDKAIDDEVVRQTSAFCKGNIDSAFVHGDAIVSGGEVYLIDMSCVNNFPTMVAVALEDITKFLIFPIIMPTSGDRKKQIDLVSNYSGQYVFNDRVDPTGMKYLYFLFRGSSMEDIQDSRANYTDAIYKMATN